MNRYRSTELLLPAALLIAVIAMAGCSVPTASDFKPSNLFSLGDDKDEPKKGTPVRMVGTWTDTTMTQPGQAPQRGFGGRLIFYGRKDDKPILVDGQLVVYAFEETGRAVTDNKPTRRYVFPPEQIPLHMSKSEIGASYSFWLPWDEAGGRQTEVSLICRFEPKNGAMIASEQTRHRLPGKLPPIDTALGSPPRLPEGVPSRPAQATLEGLQAKRAADQHVRLAGYEATQAGASGLPAEPPRMTTHSIELPKTFTLPAARSISPTIASPAAAVPSAMQPQPQAVPIPSVQPAASQPQTVPSAAQPPAVQSSRFGAFPSQPGIAPTIATPTVYSPTSAGFGFAASAQQQLAARQSQAQVQQPNTLPHGMTANAQTINWNRIQPAAAQMLQQHAQTPGQSQIIVQPASQPLPPPTGIMTTVTPPPQAGLLQ